MRAVWKNFTGQADECPSLPGDKLYLIVYISKAISHKHRSNFQFLIHFIHEY